MASSWEPRGPENGARDLAVADISSGDVEEYSRVARWPPLAEIIGCICILDGIIDDEIVAQPQVDRREVAAATDDEEETDVHDKPRLLIDDAPKESTDRIMAQQPRSTIDRKGRPRPSRHLLMMGWRTAEGRIGPN